MKWSLQFGWSEGQFSTCPQDTKWSLTAQTVAVPYHQASCSRPRGTGASCWSGNPTLTTSRQTPRAASHGNPVQCSGPSAFIFANVLLECTRLGGCSNLKFLQCTTAAIAIAHIDEAQHQFWVAPPHERDTPAQDLPLGMPRWPTGIDEQCSRLGYFHHRDNAANIGLFNLPQFLTYFCSASCSTVTGGV